MNQFKLSEDKQSIKASISGKSLTIKDVFYRKSGDYKVVKPHCFKSLIKNLNSHAWSIELGKFLNLRYDKVNCNCYNRFIKIDLALIKTVGAAIFIEDKPTSKNLKCTLSEKESDLIKKEQVVRSILQ